MTWEWQYVLVLKDGSPQNGKLGYTAGINIRA
jgi:hypothetical protein